MRTNLGSDVVVSSMMGRKDTKEIIHSGHFMVSDFDAIEAQDEEEREVAKYLVEIPDPDGDKSASEDENGVAKEEREVVEKKGKKAKLKHKNVIQYQTVASKSEAISIDGSLTKLFNAMDIAYKQKITSPKWNRFKGLKLRCKDKIRLNNVIWRCWHMQFIQKKNMRVCQFALDVDMHNKPEAIVMEGKYWKRHLDTVTAEYKKWRIYYKNKLTGCDNSHHLPPDEQWLASLDTMDWLRSPQYGLGQDCLDDDLEGMDLSDILINSLINAPQPYAFPNPREIAHTGNSDLLQPGLIQLQPNLDLMDIVEPWQEMLAGRGIMHHGLPSVPEEDFYTSDVEAAGLPPSTTNTPPSYSSSTSSPPPSSLDYLHPHHQQARLTTIESITPQHPTHDIIAAVSSNNTYDASNTCTNYDSSSTSANNYDRSSKSVTANYDTSNTSAATNYDGSSTSATTNYDTSNTSAATNYDRSSSSTTSYDRPSSSTTSYDNSSTTTASYDGSSSNTNYSNSSSANSYPDARISGFPSVMEVGNPSAVKTLSSSSFSSYTPCLSLVPSSTPSPPAAHTGSSQVLAHPPQITTPMVFPLHHSSYDCNQQQQHPAEAEVALGSSSHVVRTSDTNAAVTHTNNADNTRYMSQISRSSSLPQLQIQQQQQHSQQQATLQQQNSPTNALQQQQQQHSHSSRHHTRHQQHRRHSDNNLPHMSRALLRQDRQQSNIKQQQTNTKQQQPPLQQPQHHRLIVKSFSQQEFAKLPSPPPQLSPNSARFSPTQHASPNQSPSARHQQLSSGFAVPKLCPRRRSHSSGTSSHSASSNNSSSSSAAAAVVLSPTGLHAQPTTPSVAHYQLLQQQQHSPATADVAAAPTACAWPFLPPHSPSIVNASSSGSAATKLIAPATTTSPAAFFTQLVTKGEPSEQLQGSLQNPGIGSSQLVFGTPSNTISNSQAPVKLSFVIPGICPPLIPLTSVTTLSTPLSTSNKTFSSFNTGGPLSLKPFTSEGAVGTPVTASQFKLSSGSSPTHVTTTGAATIFASPLTIASSPLYAGNTTLSSSVITNSSSNSLPHVTLSPVTPSSLKSIPQAQLFLAAGGPNPALNLPSYIGAHTFKSSPPHAGLSSPIPSPPNKAFRPKNDHELVQYRERRRMCHINAEKKRRCSIKSNFEMLHVLIPSTSSSCNSKISKAALLNKGADYITQLKSERSQLAEQIQERKAELERLAAQISAAQSQLPATGAPMTHSRHNKLEQMYSDYVRERTLQSWKFYIFSMLGETLLDSFNANVSTASVEDLSRSALAWLDQHCSLNLLRPVVSNTMLRLSTTTSVLATPQNLPEDIYNLVAKHEEKNNTTATNNNNSGSSSNSSRSSSLVRQ